MNPRVAYFTDCYHEVNGVALTSRQFEGFAQRRGLPFLNVHAGPATKVRRRGSVISLELDPSVASVPLDADLLFDLLFLRWLEPARRRLKAFRADLIHVTSPGNFGLLGAWLAEEHRLPLVASWHTNVHEFGARRLENWLSFLPERLRRAIGAVAEGHTLNAAMSFYRRAKLVFAPNRDLIRLLRKGTGRPVFPMRRGVDTELFNPNRRCRRDDDFVLGFVGRIRPEKNARFLAAVERRLIEAGIRKYRFLIVGQGSERDWLQANLEQAEFPGVLKGDPLARAYANMDLFVFPSRTDTFGNVIQEAMASGVPAVVTNDGGPRFLVKNGETGFVARDDEEFCEQVVKVAQDEALRQRMRLAAREAMLSRSWDTVFEGVYRAYPRCLPA